MTTTLNALYAKKELKICTNKCVKHIIERYNSGKVILDVAMSHDAAVSHDAAPTSYVFIL